jgi:hypothetical protein
VTDLAGDDCFGCRWTPAFALALALGPWAALCAGLPWPREDRAWAAPRPLCPAWEALEWPPVDVVALLETAVVADFAVARWWACAPAAAGPPT